MASWTQKDLDAINDAIAQGALKVKYQDKEITYRSLEDMFAIKAQMQKDLSPSTSGTCRAYARFSKGTSKC